MTAKECLSQVTNIHQRIEALENAIATCYSRAAKSTVSYGDGTGGGGSENKIEHNVEKIDEYERKLKELADNLEKFSYEMTMEINRIPNNTYAALLINKYICDDTWAVVAEKIGKSEDYVKRELHGMALNEFERIVMTTPRYPLVFPL